jgi:hypothetical protein
MIPRKHTDLALYGDAVIVIIVVVIVLYFAKIVNYLQRILQRPTSSVCFFSLFYFGRVCKSAFVAFSR